MKEKLESVKSRIYSTNIVHEKEEMEMFVEYIPKYHRYHERKLHILMIKSGEELDWVIDALFSARKIKTLTFMQDQSFDQFLAQRDSDVRSPIDKTCMNHSRVSQDSSRIDSIMNSSR